MAFSCPLLSAPLNKRLLQAFGKEGVAAVHAFLESQDGEKWRTAIFDETSGALIMPEGHAVQVKDLMSTADLYGFAQGLMGRGLKSGLSDSGDPFAVEISQDIGDQMQIVLSSDEQKVRVEGDVVFISPEAHTTRADLVQSLITAGLQIAGTQAAVTHEARLKPVLDVVSKQLGFQGTSADFIKRLFTDETFRKRVRQLNNGHTWKAIRTWYIRHTSAKTGGVTLDNGLLGQAPRKDRLENKSKRHVERENLFDQIVRNIDNRLRNLKETDNQEGRVRTLKKQRQELMRLRSEASDSSTIEHITKKTYAALQDIWDEHQTRTESKEITHEWLEFAAAHARGMVQSIDLMTKLLSDTSEKGRSDAMVTRIKQWRADNAASRALISAIAAENHRLGPRLLAEEGVETDLETDRRYQETYETTFGNYSRLTPSGRKNRKEYLTKELFEDARREFVEQQMVLHAKEIRDAKLELMENAFRKHADGDISGLKALIYSAQQSGVKVVSFVKHIIDKIENVARTELIAFRSDLDPLFSALYDARAADLGRAPRNAKELYRPILSLDLDQNENGFLLSEINEAAFLEGKRAMEEAIKNEPDPGKRRLIRNKWFQESTEQYYNQDWYDLLNRTFPEQNETYLRIKGERTDFLRAFIGEDGVTHDFTLLTDEDVEKLKNYESRLSTVRTPTNKEEAEYFFSQVDTEETEHFLEIQAQKKAELTAEEYDTWLENQYIEPVSEYGEKKLMSIWTRMVPKNPKIYENKDYVGPNQPKMSLYRDKRYEELMARDEADPIRMFYERLVEERAVMDAARPDNLKLGFRLPAIRKTKRERFLDEGFAGIKESVKESFTVNLDETDYGDRSAEENVEGILKRSVPLFYTAVAVKNPQTANEMSLDELSFDVMRSYILDKHNSSLYRERIAKRASIENARVAVQNMDVSVRTGAGGKIFGFGIGDEATVKGSDTNIYKMLNGAIEKGIYGIGKVDESFIGMSPETWERILAYNSVSLLAGNVKSALANTVVGQSMLAIEAAAGGYVSGKAWKRAQTRYFGDVMNVLGDVGATEKHSRTNILSEYFDAMNDFGPDEFSYMYGSPDAGTMGRAKRWVASGDAMYTMSAMPEHYVQNVGMYAILEDIKVVNAEGKPIDSSGTVVSVGAGMTLLDAMQTKAGKANVNEVATHMIFLGRKIEINPENMFRVTQRIRGINEKMHGAYSDQNRGEIYRHVWGRILFQMKGWLLPQWDKRWRGVGAAWQSGIRGEERAIGYDEQLQTLHEGHYATTVYFWSTLARDFWSRRFDLSTRLDELSEHEIANLKRATLEVSGVIMSLVLFSVLKGLGDDEEDESLTQDAYYLAAYTMRRGASEYGFYFKPNEMMNLMQDPAAVFNVLESSFKLMAAVAPWNITEQYESGWREGQYKVRKPIEQMFPLFRQYGGIFHVEDSFAYYNL